MNNCKEIQILDREIAADPKNIALLEERALKNYKLSRFKNAFNDFVTILELDSDNEKAKQYITMIESVMGFEYRENINV